MNRVNRALVFLFSGFALNGSLFCHECQGMRSDASLEDTSGVTRKLAKIEMEIEAARQAENVPGLSVALVKNDRVILLRGFGLRNVEMKQPVTAQTLFAIGSVTKTFTALSAVISVGRGKISLDDSPKKYLAYFTMRDPEADARVTLRDLLSHRTGLKMEDEAGWFERHPTREGLIRFAMASEPTAGFRKAFQYNNFLYLVAGEAIGKAHGTSYEDVILRLIFKPLSMRQTNISVSSLEKSPDFSYGYSDDKAQKRLPLRSLAYLHGIAPAGAVNSSAEEMARYLSRMLGRGVLDGRQVVSEKGHQQMLS